MNRLFSVAVVMLTACSCGHGAGDADGSSDSAADDVTDVDVDPDVPDTRDIQDPDTDPDHDEPDLDVTVDDVQMDSGSDPDCVELDQDVEDLETLSLTPLPPSTRTPMDCGPACRQVSFAEHPLISRYFDVWDNYLVLHTASMSSPTVESLYLIDLDTGDHYLMDRKTWLSTPDDVSFRQFLIYQKDVTLVRFAVAGGSYGSSDLILYDISSLDNVTGRILYRNSHEFLGAGLSRMDTYGGIIIFSDQRTSDLVSNLYYHDRSTGLECFIADGADEPAIWGDRVVFHKGGLGYFGGLQIFLYEMGEGALTQLTSQPWDRFGAAIWEDRVVWTDCREGCSIIDQQLSDVYMMDLTTGIETPVCTDPAAQLAPVTIWGDRIAWNDCRLDPVHPEHCDYGSRMDIYVYDIPSGTETLVTDFPGFKHYPKLYENKLYFAMGDEAGVGSIFEITLPE